MDARVIIFLQCKLLQQPPLGMYNFGCSKEVAVVDRFNIKSRVKQPK